MATIVKMTVHDLQKYLFSFETALRIFFRIINDFVHKFILDRTFVDLTVSLLNLPFETVKSTVKPSTDLWSKMNLCTKLLILRKINVK
jgi:hypothetical protein